MGKESPKNLLESLGMQVHAWECRFLAGNAGSSLEIQVPAQEMQVPGSQGR